jgi:hypothetical protein
VEKRGGVPGPELSLVTDTPERLDYGFLLLLTELLIVTVMAEARMGQRRHMVEDKKIVVLENLK